MVLERCSRQPLLLPLMWGIIDGVIEVDDDEVVAVTAASSIMAALSLKAR